RAASARASSTAICVIGRSATRTSSCQPARRNAPGLPSSAPTRHAPPRPAFEPGRTIFIAMGWLAYLISLAFWGLIIGAFARLALPGRDPMSLLQTMLVGIAGSFIGGVIACLVTGARSAASP